MGNHLPKGWVDTRVGSISKLIRGVSYKKQDASQTQTEDSYLILRGGNIQNEKIVAGKDEVYVHQDLIKDSQKIKLHDIVIVGSTGSSKLIGKAGIADSDLKDVAFGAFLMLCRGNNALNKKYFSYFFSSNFYRQRIRDLASGVNINNIRKEYINDMILPLPPRAEQDRIVAKVDALMAQHAAIQQAMERIPQLLKDFRQQVLTQAVTGKLTEEWRVGKELKEWVENQLRDICKSITDGDHQSPPKAENGIPFLVISNISKGYLDLENVTRFVPKSYYNSLKESRVPRKGDLLYSVTGSFGIPILIKEENEFCFQRHIAIMKPTLDIVSAEFLYYLLCSEKAMNQANDVATGTAQLTVPLGGLRAFSFEIPPLQEQQEIVRRVESLFEKATAIEQRYEQLKAQIDTLPQAILHKAFKGELVEQLDSDGSAVELLREIEGLKSKSKVKSKPASSGSREVVDGKKGR